MGVLTEFLRKEGPQLLAAQREETEQILEWKEAVDRLMDQLESWLNDADPDHLLLCSRNVRPYDNGRHRYVSMPELIVRLGNRNVRIFAKARFIAGPVWFAGDTAPHPANGRVDIVDDLDGNFALYRLRVETQDLWYMMSSGIAYPLDRTRFEAAVTTLLK